MIATEQPDAPSPLPRTPVIGARFVSIWPIMPPRFRWRGQGAERRIFIQDSVSKIMSRSPFGHVYLAVDEPKGAPHSGGRELNTPRPT
jgi:hypothetical protein